MIASCGLAEPRRVASAGLGCEGFDDEHGGAAAGTTVARQGRMRAVWVGDGRGRFRFAEARVEQGSDMVEAVGTDMTGEQSVVSDAMEALGEDVE